MRISNNELTKATKNRKEFNTEEEEEFDPWGWEPSDGDDEFGVSNRDFF